MKTPSLSSYTAPSLTSYTLDDIVKQQPCLAKTREFIVLKIRHSGVSTSDPAAAEVEVLNSARYTSHTEAFTAALEDASCEASFSECCSVVKNCKVEGTGVCIAVVLLGENMHVVYSYRIVQLP